MVTDILEKAKQLWPEIPIGTRVEDISNQHFNYLTVIYRAKGPTTKGYWVC